VAVREAAREAIARARAGKGPTLLEFLTYRHKGHSRVDPGRYRPKEEVEAWLARDPLPRLAERLDPEVAKRLRETAERDVEAALEEARAAPFPDSGRPASATKETG
jgi:pyruvate dehydrogenase E1 component alpha subunit